jgi:hypothetical protein
MSDVRRLWIKAGPFSSDTRVPFKVTFSGPKLKVFRKTSLAQFLQFCEQELVELVIFFIGKLKIPGLCAAYHFVELQPRSVNASCYIADFLDGNQVAVVKNISTVFFDNTKTSGLTLILSTRFTARIFLAVVFDTRLIITFYFCEHSN